MNGPNMAVCILESYGDGERGMVAIRIDIWDFWMALWMDVDRILDGVLDGKIMANLVLI